MSKSAGMEQFRITLNGCSGEAAGNVESEMEATHSDLSQHSFPMQLSGDSSSSGVSAAYTIEELSSPGFLSHKCSEIDAMASRVVCEGRMKAIRLAITESRFCVTVADPNAPDTPLIAVSEQFLNMTGYRRAEILGNNCRILNHECNLDPIELMHLRQSCRTGAPFVGVLMNRRKSGERFLNLVDLCGLTVARNPATGDELWFVVGIQADVTHTAELSCVQDDQIAEMHRVACRIRAKLADELSALVVSAALMADFAVVESQSENGWCLLPMPRWRCTDGWPVYSSKLAFSLVASDGRFPPTRRETPGACRALRSEKALWQSPRFASVLLGVACLVGSLWRQLVRRK